MRGSTADLVPGEEVAAAAPGHPALGTLYPVLPTVHVVGPVAGVQLAVPVQAGGAGHRGHNRPRAAHIVLPAVWGGKYIGPPPNQSFFEKYSAFQISLIQNLT